MAEWVEVRRRVLARIKPDADETAEVRAVVDAVKRRLAEHLKASGLEVSVEAHGSIAHDTWLRGEHDADVFMLASPEEPRETLLRLVEEVKGFLGGGWTEAYAEHPYIRANVSGLTVEFVPCFRISPGNPVKSATDRSPLHTAYLGTRLDAEKRDEARLLKQFLRGVGVYGAEIKVGGFSGYLAELLVVAYGSFTEALKAASTWSGRQVVPTVEVHWDPRERFPEPLIAVDPVDPSRNVASAVSETAVWTLAAAAREFLTEPGERYFFPMQPEAGEERLLALLAGRSPAVVFAELRDEHPDVPDTLWGQLHKAEKALHRALAEKGFPVTRSAAWSDEKTRHVFVFEVESRTIPPTVKRVGPRVSLRADSDRFRVAYSGAEGTVAGPGIEGDRWWVTVRRQHTDAAGYLRSVLGERSVDLGVPRRLSDAAKSATVAVNEEAEPLLGEGFNAFLARFLSGRPAWVD